MVRSHALPPPHGNPTRSAANQAMVLTRRADTPQPETVVFPSIVEGHRLAELPKQICRGGGVQLARLGPEGAGKLGRGLRPGVQADRMLLFAAHAEWRGHETTRGQGRQLRLGRDGQEITEVCKLGRSVMVGENAELFQVRIGSVRFHGHSTASVVSGSRG